MFVSPASVTKLVEFLNYMMFYSQVLVRCLDYQSSCLYFRWLKKRRT